MAAKKSTGIAPSLFYLASALFFTSGGTGLVYQVIWFKRFAHLWGSSSLAFAAVGASFLFGLGLGAWLVGRWADRMPSPLRWYGVSELLIGVLALVMPYEIAYLVNASVELYAGIPTEPLLRYLVQFGITLLVIGPSCVLMGGTLPLLIRQLTARDGSLDQATGWLYAINTFGAAAGCYMAGFHLLPSWGLLWTNNLTAAVNIAIGLISIQVSLSNVHRAPVARVPKAEKDAVGGSQWSLAGLYLATLLCGCASLMLEMTWTRQLALVLGGSTYAYTSTLFVVLVGIATGSLIFHAKLRPLASSPWLPVAMVAVLGVTTLIGKLLLPALSAWVAPADVQQLRGTQVGNALLCVGVSILLELVPAVSMGVLFPLFVHLTQASAAHVGAAVGNIYAWNTLGSILGASLTAILLFPRIGTAGAMALGAGLYVVALLAVLPWRSARGAAIGGGTALGGAAVVALLTVPGNPLLTNVGMYMYGDPSYPPGATQRDDSWLTTTEVLSFVEGASCNVLVTKREQEVSLRVNGKADASNASDMVTQLGLAYFPRFFQPHAEEVLVIGYGSGCTSGACLRFPETHVTCCEIEPAVYAASEFFSDVNNRPPEQTSRFQIVFGDGRTAVQGSDKKYDMIISEPSNPWIAGVSNLFTEEFFRTAHEHLAEGGVLLQHVQTYDLTIQDYLMIVRTLSREFPHYGVMLWVNGLDSALIASDRPLVPQEGRLAELQAIVDGNPGLAADFQTWFGGQDMRYVLMHAYRVGEAQLNRLLAADSEKALNSDMNMRLEFDTPLYLFRKLRPEQSANASLLKAADRDNAWVQQLTKAMGLKPDSAEFHLQMAEYLCHQMDNPGISRVMRNAQNLFRAGVHYQLALKLDPGSQAAQQGLQRVRQLQAAP